MKLCNIEEECPAEFYIFVNSHNPITQHNFLNSGSFSSSAFFNCQESAFLEKYLSGTVKYLPYQLCEHDNLMLSPYFLTAINDYRVEYDIEIYRTKNYPLYPSRFSAIYAFGNYESCEQVSRKYGWNISTVSKFKLIPSPLNRVVKVNMDHISLARHAYKVSMMNTAQIEELWESYWDGDGNIDMELPSANFQRKIFHSGEIWEYLIEGIVQRIEQ